MSEKRKLGDDGVEAPSTPSAIDDSAALQAYKRARTDTSLILSQPTPNPPPSASTAPPRTSSLPSPTLSLTGHHAAVLCCKFSPSGTHLATAGLDKTILLWSLTPSSTPTPTPSPTPPTNIGVLTSPSPLLDLAYLSPDLLLSSSTTDAALHDLPTLTRLKRLRHHRTVVNALAPLTPSAFLTAGDDGAVLLYDRRWMRRPSASVSTPYPVLAVAASEALQQVWYAGIDPVIHCLDLRRLSSAAAPPSPLYDLPFHTSHVTGLSVSPDATLLLSHSADASLHCHSITPFIPHGATRLMQRYLGAVHDAGERALLRCAWSPDGVWVTGGNAAREVLVWEATSGEVRWRLPGHKGCVNEVQFHPTEPIIASAGNDKKVFLGEL